MNAKHYLEKHNNGDLDENEWEQLAEKMLNAHFDHEKSAAWKRQLAQMGIVRTQPGARMFSLRKLLTAAALLVGVAAATWWLWRQPTDIPAQRLAANYLEQPFRLNPGNMRGGNATDINRGRALEAFNNRQYENAVRYLQLIESEGQAKAADYFQLGLCLQYQKNADYRGALNAFDAARRADPNAYSDEINWFSSLCFLMLNEPENARASLQKVASSPSSRNRDAATNLLRKLE